MSPRKRTRGGGGRSRLGRGGRASRATSPGARSGGRGLASAVAPLASVLSDVDPKELDSFERMLLGARRIFVTGLGRTGLMARGFAMRLMHLGRRVYHVGDVITPAIRRGDVLVICSRTGRSPVLRYYVDIARKADARVAVVTGVRGSPVGKRADVVVVIPSERGPIRTHPRLGPLALPLGSLYEQALLLVTDAVIAHLMTALGLSADDLRRIHTTFE
jgi:6-phospho-3-hexuloisomerase